MSVALLVVGICGVVLASLSLGWQAANYVLTGGRVKVRLRDRCARSPVLAG